jgi:hypothetical protein
VILGKFLSELAREGLLLALSIWNAGIETALKSKSIKDGTMIRGVSAG